MNEQELRILVREAVERHLGRPDSASRVAPFNNREDEAPDVRRTRLQSRLETTHASHVTLKVVPGSELDDGMCVIEPAVRCNHCGFCRSYGH